MRFQEDFINITGIDAFEKCITIALACNLVFRTIFLQPETIALIPHNGYNPKQKQSVKGIQWLKYVSYSERCRIQYAKKGVEKAIDPYLVDGYYETEDEKKFVLEFKSDFWHRNPAKYSQARETLYTLVHMSCTTGELAFSDELHPSLKP